MGRLLAGWPRRTGFYGNTQIELAWTDIRDRHGVNALTRVEPIDGKGYFSLIEVS